MAENTKEKAPETGSEEKETPKGLEEALEAPQKPSGRRKGRPPSKTLEKKKAPGRPGRPPGTAAIMNEYKARMLASPKSEKVLTAIFDAALDPEHKNQAAAWKLIMDRMLPVSMFEQEVSKDGGRNQVKVVISTTNGDVKVSHGEDREDSDEDIREIQGEVIENAD